ncbi:ASCH domain-containing protein [Pectobacterium brasiliense]|uniref:ASCH domain-containing protein n=1 Tax=Pectobacterium brasiliense TaxID=180957 RepID=UPI00403305AA
MMSKQGLEQYPDALLWSFGDSPELADELLQLVLEGHKTATCSSYHAFKNEETPQVGDYNIVLDGAGQPSCVIRTRSLTLVRYCDITAEMAAKEGEGDKAWLSGAKAIRRFSNEKAPSPQICYWCLKSLSWLRCFDSGLVDAQSDCIF